MKIPATAAELRALVRLAKIDEQANSLTADAYRSRREAARKHVPGAVLERYEAVLELGRAPALAAIERGACSGCHIRLPTMLESQARHAPGVHVCPRCRRLLHAPELLAEREPVRAPAGKQADPRRGAPAAEKA